jgi:hypothetical protein
MRNRSQTDRPAPLVQERCEKGCVVVLVPGPRQLEFVENSEAHSPPFAKSFLSSGRFDVEEAAAAAANCATIR